MTDFDKGAMAMYDYFAFWTANHFHGNPELNRICQAENEMIQELAEDALESVSLESFNKWKTIVSLQKEINRLRAR